ncbi:EamA-like transporter family protein [Variovorax sp. PBL-H6]|uniref:DMT family transporter n=1 Tax=Variovorax sp. PBL-H6 TaxID=434009 RepID=UPI0013167B42|nr:DMT family transporter [Variovorax sp. PBL-H6]VTU34565.1 EamA-like transporter family protein [Variovorax sp. PBL-H6]
MNNLIGVALVLFFVLLSAVNGVFLSAFLVNVDVYVTLLCVFTLIAVLFNAYTFWAHGRIYRRFSRQVWLYIGLSNLTTVGNWFGFFFAVKHLEPAISATLINSVLPLATIGIAIVLLGQRRREPAELLSAVALMAAMLITAGVVFSGQSSRPAVGFDSYVFGVAMSLVCGISMALNTVVAKKLNTLGVAPSTIMAYRFFLLILTAAVLVDGPVLRADLQQFYPEMLFIAILGNLIPLFSLQLGIKRLSPVTVVFLNGLGPITHFVVQIVSGLYAFSPASLASILFATMVICVGAYYSNRSPGTRRTGKSAMLEESTKHAV